MSRKSIKIAVSADVLATEYRAGASIRDLATKYGCSFQNINIRLINAGVAMRPAGITKKHGPRKTHVCPTCGKVFKAYSRAQKFCCMEHIRRKAVCTRGHVLTEETRYHYPGSASRCKECMHIRQKAYRDRKKTSI